MMLNGVCIKKKCFNQEESHGYVKIKHEKTYLVLNIVYQEEIDQTEEKRLLHYFKMFKCCLYPEGINQTEQKMSGLC